MPRRKDSSLRYVACAVAQALGALPLALLPSVAMADNYFNPAFLSNDPSAVADLSRFEKQHSQAPGKYLVDIYLNEALISTEDVNFVASSSDKNMIIPCLTSKRLEEMGVDLKAVPDLEKLPADACVSLTDSFPGARADFNIKQLRLDISLPQAALKQNARGYIPPEQWDDGVNALMVNYNFTGSNSWGDSVNNSYYLNLQSTLNVGPWRLHDYSSGTYSGGGGSGSDSSSHDWQHISTYVQRSIVPLKGELTLGDSYTPSDVFDSLGFRGIQIASDDNMLPDSLRGFAPTVRGIAKSHAKVTVKQNGYVIYQTYVSAGAFELNDLYPTSSSGDMDVEIEEADGSKTTYSVPYSAVPLLQREGRVKYAVTGGQYHSNTQNQDKSEFAQATVIWGLPYGITAYGGVQHSDNYQSEALGMGLNLGDIGALSVDITQANSTLADDSKHKGQSLRFLYAKSLNSTGTNFQLMGYRYSTEGFYTLDETTYSRMSGYNTDNTQDDKQDEEPDLTDYYDLYYNKRGKIQVNISQQVGGNGSIYVTGSQQSYWNTDETDSVLQVGYSGNYHDVNYSVSWNYNKSQGQPEADQQVAINFSVPIGKWLSPGGADNSDVYSSPNNAYATYNNSTDNHGKMQQMAGLSGTLMKDNNLSYTVQQGYANKGDSANGNASLNYQGTYGNSNIGYNYSSGYQQVDYGMSGGIVAHANGITLSQPLGSTNVLIKAPGAANVDVENSTGVKTDWRGYAVVPYATTYRQNRIALDTNTLGDKVDLDNAVVNVVPSEGALVVADFKAHTGLRALVTLLYHHKPVPFGATVSRSDSQNATIVGDDGQAYMLSMPLSGDLQVQWGDDADQQCKVHYQLPESEMNKPLTQFKAECQ
ncbi:fimbrial biogenesis usher protein [Hafnia alvei]|uniref:fimbrial biogenesis usher protein n=1 Tax=Hafnia alvei TaxID=569 RepID=UPI000C9F5B42|nr:fimbrial biogenesis usher protein [Hafnia alvei]MBI0277972.1 fimbrial biogenesis usher protein [Hafnia alvei]PNK96889.1 fimbrial protein FimD [Hafnia alvei]